MRHSGTNSDERVEVKSNLWDDDPDRGRPIRRPRDQLTRPRPITRAVPWLMRGIEMRANALAGVPFQIVRGETAVDTTDEYKDALGFLPDPYRVLWLLEAALCFGAAYL